MKKILSVLLLAAMVVTMASCSGEGESNTTTTAATTTNAPAGPAQTAAPVVTNEPNTNDAEDQAEYPYLPDDPDRFLDDLLDGKTLVNDKVDLESLRTAGFSTYNADAEDIPQMFDGVVDADGFAAAGKGKIGGTISNTEEEGGAQFFFALTEAVKASAYVLVSGNDNATYPDRNPVSWTLYATNDASVFEAETFDPTQWAKLDYVYEGNIAAGNWLASGYAIDDANQGEYQYYCYNCLYTSGQTFQIGEFELYAG